MVNIEGPEYTTIIIAAWMSVLPSLRKITIQGAYGPSVCGCNARTILAPNVININASGHRLLTCWGLDLTDLSLLNFHFHNRHGKVIILGRNLESFDILHIKVYVRPAKPLRRLQVLQF